MCRKCVCIIMCTICVLINEIPLLSIQSSQQCMRPNNASISAQTISRSDWAPRTVHSSLDLAQLTFENSKRGGDSARKMLGMVRYGSRMYGKVRIAHSDSDKFPNNASINAKSNAIKLSLDRNVWLYLKWSLFSRSSFAYSMTTGGPLHSAI